MKQRTYVTYNLRETYHELGTFEFKIVLDPSMFKDSHMCEIHGVDSDGTRLPLEVKRWGRKMNCVMVVSPAVADGVAVMTMRLRNEEGLDVNERLTCWIVKP